MTTKNYIFPLSFFAYDFLKLHFHHFSKIKSHKEFTNQQESRFFLLFLLDDRRIRIRTVPHMVLMDPDPPDPQHYLSGLVYLIFVFYYFLYEKYGRRQGLGRGVSKLLMRLASSGFLFLNISDEDETDSSSIK